MKKRLFTILSTALLVSAFAAGCSGSKQAETTAPAAQESTSAPAETAASEPASESETAKEEESTSASANFAGMPNPMTEYKGFDEINDIVGCTLTAPEGLKLSNEKYFTISSSPITAEYMFTADGTEYMLRAARTKDDISGVYGAGGRTAGVSLDLEYDPGNSGVLQADNDYVGRWFIDDMQYLLYARDIQDGDRFRSVMDACQKAVTAASENAAATDVNVIRPLPETIFENGKLIDFTLPATLLTDSMDTIEDTTVITVQLYTEDLYDAVDVARIKPGDVLIYNGNKINVETVEQTGSVCEINNGLDNGGCQLIANEGGTYIAQEWDNYPTYTCQGAVNLRFAEDVVMNDKADLDKPDEYMGLTGDAFYDRLKTENYGFTKLNTRIQVEDNTILVVERRYTP